MLFAGFLVLASVSNSSCLQNYYCHVESTFVANFKSKVCVAYREKSVHSFFFVRSNFRNKHTSLRFDLFNLWHKQSSLRFDLSNLWNKQNSLRCDLSKV